MIGNTAVHCVALFGIALVLDMTNAATVIDYYFAPPASTRTSSSHFGSSVASSLPSPFNRFIGATTSSLDRFMGIIAAMLTLGVVATIMILVHLIVLNVVVNRAPSQTDFSITGNRLLTPESAAVNTDGCEANTVTVMQPLTTSAC
jgi:hypothetical protein